MSHYRITLLIVFLSTTMPWSGEAFSNPSSTAVRAYESRSTGSAVGITPFARSYPFAAAVVKRKQRHSFLSIRHTVSSTKTSTLLLRESLREGGKRRRGATAKATTTANGNRRWHRRLFSKLLLRQDSPAVAPLRMAVMDEETEALLDSIAIYNEEFILRDFASIVPNEILSEVILPKDLTLQDPNSSTTLTSSASAAIDSEFYNVAISPATATPTKSSKAKTKPRRSSRSKGLSLPRLMAKLIENILTSRVVKHALEVPESFLVEVEPLENSVSRLFMKGQFRANVHISTGRLVFAPIRFSQGTLKLEEVTLNLLGFLQQQQHHHHQQQSPSQQQQQRKGATDQNSSKCSNGDGGVIRYPKQFDIHVDNLTMSRHDLLFSPCVKNGLRRLLINILKDRGLQSSSIRIMSIDILPSGKISCVGDAKTHFGSPIPFEVRSGISFANGGHVLTFPGLEVSLNRDLGLFVPVVPTIDLDVGHNARFRRIRIDGNKKEIQLDASVTITPDRTIRLMKQYVQSSEAFAARFSYDVGQWLTRLGRFTK